MIRIEQKKVRSSLRRYIRKISVFKCNCPIELKHRLIPSGCTYLSYNHKDVPVYNYNGSSIKPSQRLQVTGPKTRQDICVEYGGALMQILLEFTPAGFYYIFHKSPGTYLNELVDLSQFSPGQSIENLGDQLLDTSNPDAQIELIQDYLEELSFHALPFCNYIEEAIDIIDTNIGNVLIKDLADAVHKSERQFNRQFIKTVGIPPKLYSKILQLHYVINLMNQKEFSSLKEISYSARFYDQSHFDRRFKELVGITPNEFLVSREHNALKYFNDQVKATKLPSGPIFPS